MQQVHGTAIISDGGLSRMMAWSHFMSFPFAVLSVGCLEGDVVHDMRVQKHSEQKYAKDQSQGFYSSA